MFAPEVVEPAVDFLAALAGDGAALELGIGTGRIALPLAARGIPVHGIDLSEAMVAQLRSGERFLPFAVGDAQLGFDEYDVVHQGLTSHHYYPQTGEYATFPGRYVWPSELDLM